MAAFGRRGTLPADEPVEGRRRSRSPSGGGSDLTDVEVAREVHVAFDNVCEALETAHLTVDEAFQYVRRALNLMIEGGSDSSGPVGCWKGVR